MNPNEGGIGRRESAQVGKCFGGEGFDFLPFSGGLRRGLLFILNENQKMLIKNIVTEQAVTKAKQERAKELRHEMTPAEKLLWQQIRANKLGVQF